MKEPFNENWLNPANPQPQYAQYYNDSYTVQAQQGENVINFPQRV